ncbi:MAG TPA: hypothetical protein VHI13_18605 [Candidatus Kapabacteria bacterium]|nr:hypothetical protein [Candidatus Kapabacteria bacterium]
MGKSYEEVMKELRGIGATGRVTVSVAANHDNGVISYATGTLRYYPAYTMRFMRVPERLATDSSNPLITYFSDRRLDIDPEPGPHLRMDRQPFSANEVDKLGMVISRSILPAELDVTFILISWGNATVSMSLEPRENLLVGAEPSDETGKPTGVITISFGDVTQETVPPR